MRKLIALAVVCTTGLVFAAVAYAVNVYTVTPASTKGSGGAKGTPSAPAAKAVVFGFKTKDSSGGRATPIKKYSIGFQGMKYFGNKKVFPRCSYAKTNQTLESDVEKDCKKAFIGKGKVNNLVGRTGDPATLTTCALRLRLYNTGKGFALRLDGGGTAKPPTQCPTAINQAINAKFKTLKIGGKTSTALVFTVDDTLLHPASPAVSNAISSTTSTITGKKRKVKIKGVTRRVSVLSSVSCGSKRTIQVKFTDEKGDTRPATKKVKC
jgi:hypothetical protein